MAYVLAAEVYNHFKNGGKLIEKQNQDLICAKLQIMDEIIFRFSMPDREGHYHIPIIINPNSYSVWWSGD